MARFLMKGSTTPVTARAFELMFGRLPFRSEAFDPNGERVQRKAAPKAAPARTALKSPTRSAADMRQELAASVARDPVPIHDVEVSPPSQDSIEQREAARETMEEQQRQAADEARRQERAGQELAFLRAGGSTPRMGGAERRLRELHSLARQDWNPPPSNLPWTPEAEAFAAELRRAVKEAIRSVIVPRLEQARQELAAATAERDRIIGRLEAMTR
jgi:hypothetical protein